MTALDPTAKAEADALMRHASALEARGAWSDAVDAWVRAVERVPEFLPAELALAQARIRAGRPAEALPALERTSVLAPGNAAVWLALAVARSMVGRHDEAISAAERAVACAPRLAAAQLGAGDVLRQAGRLDAAAAAYRRAVELVPDDPDALNKAAVIVRGLRKLDEAEEMLRRAVSHAPSHPYACVNLGTLLLERGRVAEGRAMLDAAARIPGLPDDARREIDEALAVEAERAALAAPIAAAIERDDPAPIVAAIRTLPRTRAVDTERLRILAAIADRLASSPTADEAFPVGVPASAAWPALEAHHNVTGARDAEAIARTVDLVAHPARASTDQARDLLRYAGVVALPHAAPSDERDAAAYEGWLRFHHARLVGHRAALGPGQFKIVNNVVSGAPATPRTPPRALRGTLEAVLRELAPRISAAAPRAAFVYFALNEMHPFADANGRVLRLALNRALRSAGRFPHLRRGPSDSGVMAAAYRSGDPLPVIAFLAEGCRYAAALDREWAARESGGAPR